jgi:hypothetical protein
MPQIETCWNRSYHGIHEKYIRYVAVIVEIILKKTLRRRRSTGDCKIKLDPKEME